MNLKNNQNTHVTFKITKNTLNLMKMAKYTPKPQNDQKYPKIF